MTTYRPQIVELIEPFMDKTLSEGCLMKNEEENHFWKIKITITDEEIEWMHHNWLFHSNSWFNWIEESKILWHYDITAVLKYIDQSKYDIEVIFDIIIKDYSWKPFWRIPNKPLHLYTEQEEKDLLELLQKLWKQS